MSLRRYNIRDPRDINNLIIFLKSWRATGEPLPPSVDNLLDEIIDRMELLAEVC